MICFVSREFQTLRGGGSAGGIGSAIRSLVGRLDSAGHSVLWLLDAPGRAFGRAQRELSGARVRVCSVDRWASGSLPLAAFRSEAHWASHRIAVALTALARDETLDLVEFPDFQGLAYTTLKMKRLGDTPLERCRIAVRLHGTGELIARAEGSGQYGVRAQQTWRLERYALRHADVLVSPSDATLALYRDLYSLAPDTEIAPPPVAVIPREAGGEAPRRSTDRLQILHFGRLQAVKGADLVVDATLRYLERSGAGTAVLHLVGSDGSGRLGPSMRRELEARIPSRFGGDFVFHGSVPRARAAALARGSDVAIFASRFETYCLGLHELAQTDVPLIVSDTPVFRSAFSPSDVRFVEPEADALLRALEEFDGGSRRTPRPPRADDTPRVYQRLARCRARPAKASPTPRARVSVVVPYFELPDTLADTLRSIEASTYDLWEAIVIDDGSHSDRARGAFEEEKRRRRDDPRFRFASQPNRGLGGARNAGVGLATGELVLPLDADDLLHPEYMARAVDALARQPGLAFVTCYTACFDASPERVSAWQAPDEPSLASLFFENGAGTPSCVFRRACFDAVRYDETLPAYEDWDLRIQLCRAGLEGEVIPEALLFYRVRAAGLARSVGHRRHAELVARLIDRHTAELAETERTALKIYTEEWARVAGLGPAPATVRGRAARRLGAWLARRYQRSGKQQLARLLDESQRTRLAGAFKRFLGALEGTGDRR